MDGWDFFFTIVGIGLVILVLLDVFLVTFHLDIDGILLPRIQNGVWAFFSFLSKKFRRQRRQIIAMAGPVMIAGTFISWICLFFLGFALIVSPHIQTSFRAEEALGKLNFLDALYYSGGTGAVLGFGDITPLRGWLQFLAVIQAAFGFALLSGVVTYMLNVAIGVSRRNRMAEEVLTQTDQTGKGVLFVARSLKVEGVPLLWTRYQSLLSSLQDVREKMHQFPILDLYYRSADRDRDPEPMIRTLAEIAIAGQLASREPSASSIRQVSLELGQSTILLMQTIARKYMRAKVLVEICNPKPTSEDQKRVQETLAHLKRQLAPEFDLKDAGDDTELVKLACRTRIFLTELDSLTGWKLDHPD